MTSPFWSLLLCSVLIVDNQLTNLSSIHDAVYSNNTHHNYNNMYIVIIFFRGYIQDICKYYHESDNQF